MSDKVLVEEDQLEMNELNITTEGRNRNDEFMDIGRIRLNRKKEGIHALKTVFDNNRNLKPIFAGAAISGLFGVYDGDDYFRVKNIPDNNKSRLMLRDLGLELYKSVDSIKSTARSIGRHRYLFKCGIKFDFVMIYAINSPPVLPAFLTIFLKAKCCNICC